MRRIPIVITGVVFLFLLLATSAVAALSVSPGYGPYVYGTVHVNETHPGVARIEIRPRGPMWTPALGPLPFEWNTFRGRDGAHTITSYSAGGTVIDSLTVIVDNTGPIIELATGPECQPPEHWAGAITGSADDGGGSGVDRVEASIERTTDGWYWDGWGWSRRQVWIRALGTTHWSVPFDPGGAGEFRVEIRAFDVLGNRGDVELFVRLVGSRDIIFQSNRDGNWELYEKPSRSLGSFDRRLTHNDADDVAPALSPDGTQIAFQSHRDGNWEIYVMGRVGVDYPVRRLTYDPADDMAPAWSPDGRWIVFQSNRDGNWEIYRMESVSGYRLRGLTRHPADDVAPAWSPDGRWIAFQSNRDGNWEIYRMDSDSGYRLRRLTRDPAADQAPSWSLDGALLGFQSDRGGDWNIYTMGSDTGYPLRQTTRDPSDEMAPQWGPLCDEINFQSNAHGNWDLFWVEAPWGLLPQRLTDNPAADLFEGLTVPAGD